jgi:hypothetical protein
MNRFTASRIAAAAALALLAVAPAAGAAEAAPDPLQPLAFLAGHCFKGTIPGRGDVDEHCFQWVLGGKALRDVHTVRGASHPDYVGETTYYWDSAARRIEYLYVETAGGIMRGTVQPGERSLVFPETRYVADGQATTLRVRWSMLPDQGYEAWSEVQGKEGWATFFRVTMARIS